MNDCQCVELYFPIADLDSLWTNQVNFHFFSGCYLHLQFEIQTIALARYVVSLVILTIELFNGESEHEICATIFLKVSHDYSWSVCAFVESEQSSIVFQFLDDVIKIFI